MPNAADQKDGSDSRPPNTWHSAVSDLLRGALVHSVLEVVSIVLLVSGGIALIRVLRYRWGVVLVGVGIVAALFIVCRAVAKWEFWREETRAWVRVPARIAVFGTPVLMAMLTSFAVLSYLIGWP